MAVIPGLSIFGRPICGICKIFNAEIPAPSPAHNSREYDLEQLVSLKTQNSSLTDSVSAAVAQMRTDILEEAIRRLENGEFDSADSAVRKITDELSSLLTANNNPYFKSRVDDLQSIANDLCIALSGNKTSAVFQPGSIVIADRIDVCSVMEMIAHQVGGIVVRKLDTLSHAYLLLKGSGITCAVGAFDLNAFIDGNIVEIDPEKGTVETDLKSCTFEVFPSESNYKAEFSLPDGNILHIALNSCGSWEDLPANAVIGLLRSEFFIIALKRMPTEEELIAEYSNLFQRCRQTTVRLIDNDIDKQVPGMHSSGKRGIAALFDTPALLRLQLRSVLCAAHNHNVRLLIPYIEDINSLQRVRAFIADIDRDLTAEGKLHESALPVGVMLETAASVSCAELFASEADFAAIGTNDLCAEICGSRKSAAGLSERERSDLFAMISKCIKAFDNAHREICICGDIAADPTYLPHLLTLGIRRISIPYSSYRSIASAVSQR